MKLKDKTRAKIDESIFLIAILAIPLIQVIIFYIGVNFNSILLSIQEMDPQTGEFHFLSIGNIFGNYGEAVKDLFDTNSNVGWILRNAVVNSAIQFAFSILSLVISIIASYFIWKKVPMYGFFQVIVFLPSIISNIVFVLMARYFLENAMPQLFGIDFNFFAADKQFYTILFFGVWLGFATGMVVFLGAMSGIDDELIEYGQLEGLTAFKEFFWVVIPGIFPTITTYIIATLAGYFTNKGHFYSFFGSDTTGLFAESNYTLGYFFFHKVVGQDSSSFFPYASAYGIMFTLILVPLTLFTKRMLEKYGPSAE